MRGDMIAADRAEWTFLSDRVMGGVSDGRIDRQDGLPRLVGRVSTENRGGFLQIRTPLDGPAHKGATEVRLLVRANGERYYLHIRTTDCKRPWEVYRASFETSRDWSWRSVPIAGFRGEGGALPPLDPGRATSLGIVAYGRDHAADITLAAFGLY